MYDSPIVLVEIRRLSGGRLLGQGEMHLGATAHLPEKTGMYIAAETTAHRSNEARIETESPDICLELGGDANSAHIDEKQQSSHVGPVIAYIWATDPRRMG